MKLTTLTAILVISLFSVSASLAGDGNSTYLEEHSARLQQELSQPQSQQMMETQRLQHRSTRQTSRGFQQEQDRWWR
ncbi:hypothetical protein BOX17_02580 [Halomonas aestuarii]|uniref:Uncharacterized protein n=1 Tax=Halomonas aestuarii TaxID=1897729 RepID=A0A1J0VD42_9GAMM|nr:hypothetical protein [Halomonas aestuarii]APE29943.1 hypothetical protein BOX17_02580 [Halomonas aestuarii]